MKEILYISDLNEAEPIYHSQVIPHVNELKKFFDVTLMVLRRNAETKQANGAFNYDSVRGDYVYSIARTSFLKQKNRIRSLTESSNFDFIYSRGIRGGIVGSFIKQNFYSGQIALLNDTRGYALDGMKNNFINKAILDQSNKTIYASTDILFLVSNFLRNKICRDYNFNMSKAFVFPTFVQDHKFDFKEENRRSIRQEFDFKETDLVILYSGALTKYQNVEAILAAFKQSSNPHLKMLILTKDKEIQPLIQKYQLSDQKIKIRSATSENIEKYYHAADFGILIRDNTITNKSAAPTKFSEYVNSGLSLIINLIEADYVELFKEKKLEGFLLDKKEDLLDCFNNMKISDVKRNVIKINLLSDLVKKQKEVLNNFKHPNKPPVY